MAFDQRSVSASAAIMHSWVYSQSLPTIDVMEMQFNNVSDTPSTRYSLIDKISTSNSPVISCYGNVQINHSFSMYRSNFHKIEFSAIKLKEEDPCQSASVALRVNS